MTQVRRRLIVHGVVQGVGFRPRVHQLALALGLGGFVVNRRGNVSIEVEGNVDQVAEFAQRLTRFSPPVVVERVTSQRVPLQGASRFDILQDPLSGDADATGDLSITNVLAPDSVWCVACQREFAEQGDRRSGYVFTHCVSCGPRYSVTRSLPYERSHTSMAAFPPCPSCQGEYETPTDRRFHAQNVACPACGPQLVFEPTDVRFAAPDLSPIDAAMSALRSGASVAILGVGGYQILVDATNDAAVARLRQAKQRPHKPLAVLFDSLAQMSRYCAVSPSECVALTGAAGPIVLLDLKAPERGAATLSIHLTDTPRLGALLPTTGLHASLTRGMGKPLVCTSGNHAGEPMCATPAAARAQLSNVVDAFLHHDRVVTNPLDDSVVQVVNERVRLLRRARGYAPLRAAHIPSRECLLALGGHSKNTFTLSLNGEALLSPHLADLSQERAITQAEQTLRGWLRIYGAKPRVIACDLNPSYASTALAQRLAREFDAACVYVQHHHAHIAAVLAEHETMGSALGLAWDGFGYGLRGELWGAETLLCEGARAKHVGSVLPFRLPGGPDACAREPRRTALGLLHAAELPLPRGGTLGFTPDEMARLGALLTANLRSPACTSMGRLFDGFAALFAGCLQNHYEGQAASRWMALAESYDEPAPAYTVLLTEGGVFDWRPMLTEALAEHQSCSAARIARRFHETLAILALAFAALHPGLPLVLGGGCFQNRLLTWLIERHANSHGLRCLTPAGVPANDGGLSVGQIWLTALGQ